MDIEDRWKHAVDPDVRSKKYVFEQMREGNLSPPQLLALWREFFSDDCARNPKLDKIIAGSALDAAPSAAR